MYIILPNRLFSPLSHLKHDHIVHYSYFLLTSIDLLIDSKFISEETLRKVVSNFIVVLDLSNSPGYIVHRILLRNWAISQHGPRLGSKYIDFNSYCGTHISNIFSYRKRVIGSLSQAHFNWYKCWLICKSWTFCLSAHDQHVLTFYKLAEYVH